MTKKVLSINRLKAKILKKKKQNKTSNTLFDLTSAHITSSITDDICPPCHSTSNTEQILNKTNFKGSDTGDMTWLGWCALLQDTATGHPSNYAYDSWHTNTVCSYFNVLWIIVQQGEKISGRNSICLNPDLSTYHSLAVLVGSKQLHVHVNRKTKPWHFSSHMISCNAQDTRHRTGPGLIQKHSTIITKL